MFFFVFSVRVFFTLCLPVLYDLPRCVCVCVCAACNFDLISMQWLHFSSDALLSCLWLANATALCTSMNIEPKNTQTSLWEIQLSKLPYLAMKQNDDAVAVCYCPKLSYRIDLRAAPTTTTKCISCNHISQSNENCCDWACAVCIVSVTDRAFTFALLHSALPVYMLMSMSEPHIKKQTHIAAQYAAMPVNLEQRNTKHHCYSRYR